MALSVGSSAPDFTLLTLREGKLDAVTLSSHKGEKNVVLLFYPGAFTPVCTQELCDVTSGLGQFAAVNAVVYGVSPDSPFALAAWAKEFKIEFSLLSDYAHTVTQSYGVVWPDFAGLGPGTSRAVVLIDKEGTVQYVEVCEKLTDMPNLDALQAKLAEL
ncbi:peroxiredoxin [soil metagenome]